MHDYYSCIITGFDDYFRRYITFYRWSIGSHAWSRFTVPIAIRWSFVATAFELVETTWTGDFAQHMQHGHAGTLYAILLPRNLWSSL